MSCENSLAPSSFQVQRIAKPVRIGKPSGGVQHGDLLVREQFVHMALILFPTHVCHKTLAHASAAAACAAPTRQNRR